MIVGGCVVVGACARGSIVLGGAHVGGVGGGLLATMAGVTAGTSARVAAQEDIVFFCALSGEKRKLDLIQSLFSSIQGHTHKVPG